MTDFIKDGLLAAADDYERGHVAKAAAMLDDSTALRGEVAAADADTAFWSDAPATAPDQERLSRAEGDLIAAWGELYQIPGFAPIEGERLHAAIRRALSEAANRKD